MDMSELRNNTKLESTGHGYIVNRRDFMKLSGVMASGLMMSSSLWASSMMNKDAAGMAIHPTQYITPTILSNNAARLTLGSSFVSAGLKHCLTPNLHTITAGNAFTMGAQMPFDLGQLTDSLIKIKEKWSSGAQDEATAQRLAVLSGAITHKVIIEQLKPANVSSVTTPSGNEEHKIYQDAILINHYFTKGKSMNVDELPVLHSILRQMAPRTFVRFHTLMPDEADGRAWIMNIAAWRKQLEDYFAELSKAVAHPDPDKVKKYIKDVRYLDGGELILVKVATFTRIPTIDRKDAEEYIHHPSNTSASSKALASGYKSLINISDFLSGTMDKGKLKSEIMG